jgi:hypothetical protein
MYKFPDYFEIALSLETELHGRQRIICTSHGHFMASCRTFFRIAKGKTPLPLPLNAMLPTEPFEATLTLDAILPGGKNVPFALYKKTLSAGDLGTILKWSDPPPKKLPERVVFCASRGGICVEDQDGWMIGEADFFSCFVPYDERLSALTEEIHSWQSLYENGVSGDLEANRAFDWDGFHAQGIALCEKIQQYLGQRSQVFYRRKTELAAPNNENSLVVFFPCHEGSVSKRGENTRHQFPEHVEIALTLSSQCHGQERMVCASYKNFIDGYRAIDLIVGGDTPLPLPHDHALPIETVHATLTLDAVLADGQIVPYALYEIPDLHNDELSDTIRWPLPGSDALPERIVFCPDFGGVCVRDQEGVVIGASDFFSHFRPRDERLYALGNEIQAWQSLYESGVNLDCEKNLSFDWDDFHAKGIAICDQVQQLLGSRSQVFYRRITECAPPNDENSLMVFFPD